MHIIDVFDRRILEVLSSVTPRSFPEIQSKVDFTHNTLRQHQDQLLEKNLVERRKMPNEGPGRPSYVYIINADARRNISALLRPILGMVTLSFESLQSLCRYEKGDYCKENRGSCGAEKCPKAIK
ncbi:MAG: hypothetical protein ABID54_12960 [Pseudomonadota bacterium]